MFKRTLFITSVCVFSSSIAASEQITDSVAPEATQSVEMKSSVVANQFMVAAANPLAVKAGYDVLKSGGTAADALVAVQTVLGLVEPQSSGLGGGAFLVYYDAKKHKLTTFDGRETAPMNARPELFQDSKGEPLQFYDAVVGGLSVGTPGTVKLIATLHEKYGSQPWADLFQPAERLARQGFDVSPRLAGAIADDHERLGRYPDTRAYFFHKDGTPLKAGERLVNTPYADTLKLLAEQGQSAFYHGQIAKDITAKVQGVSDNPGVLSEHDFALYKVIEREPVCAPYHQYDVCGMGPPSSGALTIGQILGMVSHFDLAKMGKDDPTAWQIIGDASRLAFADRGRYMADTDYVPMPEGLLDPDYLASRAKLITPGKALTDVEAGSPPWKNRVAMADDQSIEFPCTTQIVIVDKQGNIISMTSTIENGFGSRVMSHGFLLNNELTDFSFASYSDGYPIANRVEPGKRPRSSMAPTIVMKDDKPYMAVGSPGGSQIIGYVASTLIAHFDWGLDIQSAISLPHLSNRFGDYDLEADTSAVRFKEPLEAMGFKVNIKDLNSGLQGIILSDDKLIGGADPRREGIAMGD
ncbi:gamma-glutamyltransferase [Vibrio viridaestus]|uniref:Glutathione hydrolase proenzyme n=1 Tax=Vibrio viridaestus TaxID=2487322 RepID=A0A3N9TKB1_9VIBR|nr:gamma-glutamyltransferase [Vibrio viridaestus]RQW64828.1 gamma-glutamyltransferase [Vibrio viridaestus]